MKLDVNSLTECPSRTASPKSPPFGDRAIVTFPGCARDDPTGPTKDVFQERGEISRRKRVPDRLGTSPGPAHRWVVVCAESRALVVAHVPPRSPDRS